MTAKAAADDTATETQAELEQASVTNVNGEVSDEALVNAWVVGVGYVNPADPDGPTGPEGPAEG